MKALRVILHTLGVITFIMGCGNPSNEKSQEQTETHKQRHPGDESERINLNNGEKWLVNEEMKPFILDAETLLNEYIEKESNDYITLAAQLKEKNSGLIKSCTMKGESHNELHKWLYPHIKLIESLSEAENMENSNLIIDQLKSSFTTFNQYFQ